MITKRKIDKLGIETSLLGFGCMRFPTRDGKIDRERSEKMLDEAYAKGVNYFDTAYPYHGGESEEFTGKVLDKYPRESYFLATKLPCWLVNSLDDAKRIFEEQLTKLNKDYVDFYLLHSLGRDGWNRMKELGIVEYCEGLKREGKIRYLGFSFHDSYEVFEDIASYRNWDFCQIQLNYMDTDEQAGMRGYELTEKLNIPLVIMEPIKGGSLANLPDEITGQFRAISPDNSTASWALRWVATLPNVKVVLSGMSDEAQVADNIGTFTDFAPLTENEQAAVMNIADMLRKRVNNGCTGCNYCMPCPAGVNIPYNFRIWNTYGIYENKGASHWEWNNSIAKEQKADNCIGCGKCEKACPQKLPIREHLAKLKKELDSLYD
ncbi:MAG: aldo/keto reductase [Huintestinicola sp.]